MATVPPPILPSTSYHSIPSERHSAVEAYLRVLSQLQHHGPRIDIEFDVTHSVVAERTWLDWGLARGAPAPRVCTMQGVRGAVRAGSSTLLLGNPGAGRSTLLGAMAGVITGPEVKVQWNGLPPASCGGNPRKLATLVHQHDVFEPLLTVRETLRFAAESCLLALPVGASPALVELRASITEHVLDVLGLHDCADVIVGDELRRGVSGGQRKRVALGEALLCGARVLCCDEVTNGLDAATALEIVHFLTQWARVTGGTLVCALQAPMPEVTALFDEVVLLSDGRCLYAGPTRGCLPYLATCGYASFPGMSLGEYAVALAISPGYVINSAPPGSPRPALDTREALADAWEATADKRAAEGPALMTGGVPLDGPIVRVQYGTPHVHSVLHHTRLLAARQVQLLRRDPTMGFARIVVYAAMGLVFGSLFWQIDPNNYSLLISMAVFCAGAVAYGGLAELPSAFIGKRNALRQMERGMFPASAYVASVIAVASPLNSACVMVLGGIFYACAGLTSDASHVSFFLGMIVCHELAMTSLYRFFAFASPVEEMAQMAAGVATGMLVVLGGFSIAYPLIIVQSPEFLPAYYFTPFSWTIRALANSIFRTPYYERPSDPPTNMTPLSSTYLATFGFFDGVVWEWLGLGYCIAFALLFGPVLSTYVLTRGVCVDPIGSQRLSAEGPQHIVAVEGGASAPLLADGVGASSASDDSSVDVALAVREPVVASTLASSAPAPPAPASPTPTMDLALPASASPAPFSSKPASASLSASPGTSSLPSGASHYNLLGQSVRTRAMLSSAASHSNLAEGGLEFSPATLTFRDVVYSVTLRDGTAKTLLRGVSGTVLPGRLHALMGTSGAGKTTLLDVLAGRKTTGALEGSIHVNGRPVSRGEFSRSAGFAEQQDVHARFATVREALRFSAQLRLPRSVARHVQHRYVEELLLLLDLDVVAERFTHTLSGGELKRLTIGVELASNPSILFLDEPTTGLDARAAASVLVAIRRIATSGRTVLCTIHAPTYDVFRAFDDLTALVPLADGVTSSLAYHGPIGARAADVLAYAQAAAAAVRSWHEELAASSHEKLSASSHEKLAESRGIDSPQHFPAPTASSACDAGLEEPNPAVTVMDAFSDLAAAKLHGSLYAASEAGKVSAARLDALHTAASAARSVGADALLEARPGVITQFKLLVFRMTLFSARNTAWVGARVSSQLLVGILFGLLYLHTPTNTYKGVWAQCCAPLSSTLFACVVTISSGMTEYSGLRPVFYRERAAGFYSAVLYPLAIFVTEIPFSAIYVFADVVPLYFLVGYNASAVKFFWAYFSVFVSNVWFATMGQALIAVFPQKLFASLVVGPIVQMTLVFAGINVPVYSMPPDWRFMYYANGLAEMLRLWLLPQFAGNNTLISVVVNGASVPTPVSEFVFGRLGASDMVLGQTVGAFAAIVAGALVISCFAHVFIDYTVR